MSAFDTSSFFNGTAKTVNYGTMIDDFVGRFNGSAEDAANSSQAYADSFAGWLGDLLGQGNKAQAAYFKTKANQEYEQKATASARAWDEYMASTQYQRAVKDLKAAGLNPWLALQSGISTQAGGHTAGSGSSARYVSEEKTSKNTLTSLALLFVSCARLLAAL